MYIYSNPRIFPAEPLLSESSSKEVDYFTSNPNPIDKLKNTLDNLQQRIDMAAAEDASFKKIIKSLENKQAFQHRDIESHINKTKNIIDQNINGLETTEFDFQSRKLNELLAYRNYELSKYLRKELEHRINPMLGGQLNEAQNQNGMDILLSKIESTGIFGTISESRVSTERCKLITDHLIEKKKSLQTKLEALKEDLTALEIESSDMKLEIETIQKTVKKQNEEYDAITLKLCEKVKKINSFYCSFKSMSKSMNWYQLEGCTKAWIKALSEEVSE